MNLKKQRENLLLDKYKVLALIPARSGSKRLPKKNLLKFCGKPLIAHSFIEAKKSKIIDDVIISSDDKKILELAKYYDIKVPFIRPKSLANNKSNMFSVIEHTLKNIKDNYDILILLQPTSPLRKVEDIDNALLSLKKNNAKMLVSANKIGQPQEWIFKPTNKMFLGSSSINFTSGKRSQDYTESYIINGAIFIAHINELLKSKTFFNPKTFVFIMELKSSIDIDNKEDFLLAEYFMKNNI